MHECCGFFFSLFLLQSKGLLSSLKDDKTHFFGNRMVRTKSVLNSPYVLDYRPVGSEDQVQRILRCLETDVVPFFSRKKRHTNKFKESSSSSSSSSLPELPKYVVFGMNEVTKALERKQVSLVIVCGDVKPHLLCQHVYLMATIGSVPLCLLTSSSEAGLAKLFNLRSLSMLAFVNEPKNASEKDDGEKQCCDDGDVDVRARTLWDACEFVKTLVPPVNVPEWLDGKFRAAVVAQQPCNDRSKEKQERRRVKRQKTK
jgi:ribosomal protein L7Ae-like RNA K-turn-binding protein